MALQTSIVQYFNNRKRQAIDEGKRDNPPNKVLILDQNITDVSSIKSSITDERFSTVDQRIIIAETDVPERKKIVPLIPKQPRKTPKLSSSKNKKESGTRSVKQPDIRKSLFPQVQKQLTKEAEETTDGSPKEKKDKPDAEVPETVIVPFEVRGILSPSKQKRVLPVETPQVTKPTLEEPASRPVQKLNSLKKELGLGQVKAKLTRSSRLDEIQGALERLRQGHDKLNAISKKIPPKSPSLKEFKTIQLEVPSSPAKTVIEVFKEMRSPSKLREAAFRSPAKPSSANLPYTSPRKLFDEARPVQLSPAKSPAFQRYYSLVSSGKPALILPYKFRSLAETFRSVDTVVSIMFNRNETIAFPRLKTSVQELSKKNLTEHHIGQIMAVLPSAFTLTLEKVRQFGSAVKTDKPELVLAPNIDVTNNGCDRKLGVKSGDRMTPSVLLERRRQFFQTLIERTKAHHEEFLKSLEPPMVIPGDKLTRWHPEFDLEGCPDIQPAILPQAPDTDKFSTAKDVLNKAREMLMVNPRMEKALQRLSENDGSSQTAGPSPIPALANALKGIPKSLLEKVRARQAAKAIEMLTRNPEESKRGIEMGRLPELARIVRTLFIGEKKTVLPFAVVLDKLTTSYREILTPVEMEQHLKLLVEKVPGWLTHHSFEKQNFLKMAKNMDMSKIMADLNHQASKNIF